MEERERVWSRGGNELKNISTSPPGPAVQQGRKRKQQSPERAAGKQCLGVSKEVKRRFSKALRIRGIMLTVDLKFQRASEIL